MRATIPTPIIVGRDPEIAVMRPPELAKLILNFFGILDVIAASSRMLLQRALAGLDARGERPSSRKANGAKVSRVARIWTGDLRRDHRAGALDGLDPAARW